jgi:hypothetical protein
MEWLWKIPLGTLVVAWGIYFWATPSAKVEKDLGALRAWIKKRISKLQGTTSLPDRVPFSSVSFYATGGEISNVGVGAKDGFEYVCFDWDPHGELSESITIVALRAEYPLEPMTWLARSTGIKIERFEDWVFAYDPGRLVGTRERLSFVNEVMTFLEYATEFPQNK